VVAGTSSGDFMPFRLKGGLGWLVRYADDGVSNFLPAADCPEPIQEIAIGLMGRERRARDGVELEVVHIERPEDDGV
jgi:hypothetical protein